MFQLTNFHKGSTLAPPQVLVPNTKNIATPTTDLVTTTLHPLQVTRATTSDFKGRYQYVNGDEVSIPPVGICIDISYKRKHICSVQFQ